MAQIPFKTFLFVWATLSSTQIFGISFGEVAFFALRNTSMEMFTKIKLPKQRSCLSQPNAKMLWGNDIYGYYTLSPNLMSKAQKLGELQLLPLGYKLPHNLYCKTSKVTVLLGSYQVIDKRPKLFIELEPVLESGQLSQGFYLGSGSIPYVDHEFVHPEEKSNLGFIYLFNSLGEFVWIYIPARGRKILSNEIAVDYLGDGRFFLVSDNYWETFDIKGHPLSSGTLCNASHSCTSDAPKYIAGYQGKSILISGSKLSYQRSSLKDVFLGPSKKIVEAIGALNPQSRSFHFNVEPTPPPATTFPSQTFFFHNNKTLTLTPEGLTLYGKATSSFYAIQSALAASFTHSMKNVLAIAGEGLEYRILKIRPTNESLVKVAESRIKTSHAIYRASLTQATNGNGYLYATRSDPTRFEVRQIPSDLLMQIAPGTLDITATLALTQSFYSPSIKIAYLEALPDMKAIRMSK